MRRFTGQFVRSVAAAGLILGANAAGLPSVAAPPDKAPAPSPDTKAPIVHFALELLRTDTPAAPGGGTLGAPPTAIPAVPGAAPVTTVAPLVAGSAPTAAPVPTTLRMATPILSTIDNVTASIGVSGGDISYTISLSPSIGADGRILILWNLRLSGKSLPGATSVATTGAIRVDPGKSGGIAEIRLTDPATGRASAFRLQGVVTVENSGSAAQSAAATQP